MDKPFKLQVDASHVGAGAVVMQSDGQGMDRPVSFFSTKFNKRQLNYFVIEKETLDLVWALSNFRVYVGSGMPVVVYFTYVTSVFLLSKSP